MRASYDPARVVLSVLIAFIASYAALEMARRVSASARRVSMVWLAGGSLVIGIGIASMHFVAMLALSLPVPIAYHVPTILVATLIAVGFSFPALVLVDRRVVGSPSLWAAAGCLGVAIVGFHYTAMAAMRMAASVSYDAILAALSILIGVALSFSSVWLVYRTPVGGSTQQGWRRSAGVLAMGGAIAGMHYTAMAGTGFHPGSWELASARRAVLASSALSTVVTASSLLIAGVALAAAAMDRRAQRNLALSRRLLEAQEAARRRIAQQLHDGVGQLLTAVQLNLQRAEMVVGQPAAASLADTRTLVDQALQQVRDLAVELRPVVLGDLGLKAALKWYVGRQAERVGFAVDLMDALPEARLPADVEVAVFRVLQEAVTNVARHAGAKNVTVALRRVGGMVELTVADDGRGFDVDAARRRAMAGESLGLLEMQETASLAGGLFTVTSERGRGTTVRARFAAGAVG